MELILGPIADRQLAIISQTVDLGPLLLIGINIADEITYTSPNVNVVTVEV